MVKIHDVPDRVTNAGLDFNFNVWSAGSRVTLANVPWNNDYRDIVKYANQAALDTYLMSTPTSIIDVQGTTYLKPGTPIRLNVPLNSAYKFNYLRASNPAHGADSARSFYYFILDVRFVAPNTTEFVLQLDVWQSFGLDAKFGNCYIERGHYGVANSNQMSNAGRDYLTIPEGLDIGGEYGICGSYQYEIANNTTNHPNNIDIIMATTVSLEGSGGTVDKPTLVSSKGSDFEALPNGCEFYWFANVTQFKMFMNRAADYPWVTSGIISIMAVPPLVNPNVETFASSLGGHQVSRLKGGTGVNTLRTLTNSENWREVLLNNYYEARYRHLKKFLTYPYTVVELTTHTGNPLLLKPESMTEGSIQVMEMMHLGLPNPRSSYHPYRYNAMKNVGGTYESIEGANDKGEFLDMTTGITNFPTFSVVNNSYMQFMASNANSIAYQHASADWSQQKALQGNDLSAAQSTAGINASVATAGQNMAGQRNSVGIQNQAAASQAMLSAGTSLAGGLGGGPAGIVGGGANALTAGASTAISTMANNSQLANSLNTQRANLETSTGLAAYMRDSNKDFADFAATGDYQNTIAAITAKVQDAKLIQPTTSGQLGGDAFLLSNYKWEVRAKVKTVVGASRVAIGEYWLRYGYAVNRFATPPQSLMVMDKFTYWKLKETYLTSLACPESFKQVIRGIFEKGVTVWADARDIGNIDLANNRVIGG